MKHMKLSVLVLAVLAVSAHLFADTVTIVPFAYQGISQGDAETFTEMFVSEYASVTHDDVADRSNFDGIAEQHKFQLTDWSNNDKIAKLGKAMNAGKIICGRISVFGSAVTFTGRVLDVNSTKVLNSINWKGESLESLLFDITNIAKKLAGRYSIGEKGPGGGIIFYESEAGFSMQEADGTITTCHYLEVSPLELGNLHWCPCEDSNHMCDINTIDGVGAGKLNTAHIVNSAHQKLLTPSNCAAYACSRYSTGTTKVGDWYLPSKMELDLIYKNLVKTGIVKSMQHFWSSSQEDKNLAWGKWFSDVDVRFDGGMFREAGFGGGFFKPHPEFAVRAVRAF